MPGTAFQDIGLQRDWWPRAVMRDTSQKTGPSFASAVPRGVRQVVWVGGSLHPIRGEEGWIVKRTAGPPGDEMYREIRGSERTQNVGFP